jgi:hypothetical protein
MLGSIVSDVFSKIAEDISGVPSTSQEASEAVLLRGCPPNCVNASQLKRELDAAAVVASAEIASFEKKLFSQPRELALLQGAYEAMRDSDLQTLKELLLPAISNSDMRSVMIIELEGDVLLDIVFPEGSAEPHPDGQLTGRNLSMVPTVNRVLSGEEDALGDHFAGLVDIVRTGYYPLSLSSGHQRSLPDTSRRARNGGQEGSFCLFDIPDTPRDI